eukprot:COSAG05_NODE_4921_length_1325_cov_3129.902936_2_plen_144_part_00
MASELVIAVLLFRLLSLCVCRLGTGTFTLVLNEEMLRDAVANPDDANGDEGYSDEEDPVAVSPNAHTPDSMSPFAVGTSPFVDSTSGFSPIENNGFSPVAAGFSVCSIALTLRPPSIRHERTAMLLMYVCVAADWKLWWHLSF